MNKKLIRLTESDLHRIVKKSVNRILKESFDDDEIARLVKEHGGLSSSSEILSFASSQDIEEVLPNEQQAIGFLKGTNRYNEVEIGTDGESEYLGNNPDIVFLKDDYVIVFKKGTSERNNAQIEDKRKERKIRRNKERNAFINNSYDFNSQYINPNKELGQRFDDRQWLMRLKNND